MGLLSNFMESAAAGLGAAATGMAQSIDDEIKQARALALEEQRQRISQTIRREDDEYAFGKTKERAPELTKMKVAEQSTLAEAKVADAEKLNPRVQALATSDAKAKATTDMDITKSQAGDKTYMEALRKLESAKESSATRASAAASIFALDRAKLMANAQDALANAKTDEEKSAARTRLAALNSKGDDPKDAMALSRIATSYLTAAKDAEAAGQSEEAKNFRSRADAISKLAESQLASTGDKPPSGFKLLKDGPEQKKPEAKGMIDTGPKPEAQPKEEPKPVEPKVSPAAQNRMDLLKLIKERDAAESKYAASPKERRDKEATLKALDANIARLRQQGA